jgi:hypothetical protein
MRCSATRAVTDYLGATASELQLFIANSAMMTSPVHFGERAWLRASRYHDAEAMDRFVQGDALFSADYFLCMILLRHSRMRRALDPTEH